MGLLETKVKLLENEMIIFRMWMKSHPQSHWCWFFLDEKAWKRQFSFLVPMQNKIYIYIKVYIQFGITTTFLDVEYEWVTVASKPSIENLWLIKLLGIPTFFPHWLRGALPTYLIGQSIRINNQLAGIALLVPSCYYQKETKRFLPNWSVDREGQIWWICIVSGINISMSDSRF